MRNAGIYNHKITIYLVETLKDADGFPYEHERIILEPKASVKTTRGSTIIRNNSDFELALTNFTIRYPKTEINRDMLVRYRDKRYTIEYLNNVDEDNLQLEMQCKEITH